MAVARRTPLSSNVRIIGKESYRTVPWKNGGGVTAEIAASSPVDPLWRLSIATIERDGPFSDFSGYDRTIVPISGNGVELTFDGDERVILDKPFQPYAFRGERRVSGRLIDGAVRDFNVMTRRDAYCHTVVITNAAGIARDDAEITFALVLDGSIASARTGDTLMVTGAPTTLEDAKRSNAILCVVQLFRTTS
jgi:environmental stress-induced protein Ves